MKAQPLDIDIEAELVRFQARRVTRRSPGRHLSEVLHYLMNVIDPKRFANGPIDPLLAQGGFIWEDVLNHVFANQLGMKQIELCRDEIFVTLDGFNTAKWRTREAKATKISANNPITSSKFLHWHMQMMGGCKVAETEECELVVLHLNGAYELAGGKFGKTVGKPWLMWFSKREIEDNWRMILRTRDRMDEEGV